MRFVIKLLIKHGPTPLRHRGVTRGGRVAHPLNVWGKFWKEGGKEEKEKGEGKRGEGEKEVREMERKRREFVRRKA